MRGLLQVKLIRLLAVNLTVGVAAAALMLGGLIALEPRLRAPLLADYTALMLLAFGFVVTFGSVAMGTAVMALGRKPRERGRGGGKRAEVKAKAR